MKFVDGNIVDVGKAMAAENPTIICHQVNCQRTMGSGVAKTVRDAFPEVYEAYLKFEPRLGAVQVCATHCPQLFVANIFGQDRYGRGKQHTVYRAVVEAFDSLEARRPKGSKVLIPHHMGCGLGGGDWAIYLSIAQNAVKNDLYVVAYGGRKQFLVSGS